MGDKTNKGMDSAKIYCIVDGEVCFAFLDTAYYVIKACPRVDAYGFCSEKPSLKEWEIEVESSWFETLE